MRDVLCLAARIEPGSTAVSYAVDLAAHLGGNATGVHVQDSPLDRMPRFGSPALLDMLLQHAREQESMARACGEAFVEHAHGLGIRHACWQVAKGFVPDVLARMSLWHDIIVLERDATRPWCTPADLGRLVLNSPLPCIIVPEGRKEADLRCIVLAWNGSLQAIRSIHAALPLLRRATRVILLEGDRRSAAGQGTWAPTFAVEAYLAAHAIRAQKQAVATTRYGDGAALLAAAMQAGAGLLVMGAYGRNRLDEWAFGGATRSALHDATIPVLLRH